MKQYRVIKNNEQLGPFAEEHIKEQLTAGELSFNDLCWTEGMEEWQPLHVTLEMPEMAAPPPAPVMPPPPPIEKQGPIGWLASLMTMSMATPLCVLISILLIFSESRGQDFGEIWEYNWRILVIVFLFQIAAVAFCSILHYKCWAAVPPQYRFTTPARAIGFMFIPFYNFYWAFITWPKLVDGLIAAGFKLPSSARHLSIVYSVVFVCSWTIGLISWFDILATIAQLVIFILFYRQLVVAINSVDDAAYKMV